jgi:hypothetical protein
MLNNGSWWLLLLSLLLTATACSTSRVTYLPDGQKAYAISCKGYLDSWQSCLVHAGRICGTRGYNAIRSEEADRELLFSCKTP